MHIIIYSEKFKGFGHPLLTCPTFYFISSIVIPMNFVTELFIVILSMKFSNIKKKNNLQRTHSTSTQVQTPGKVLLKDNEQKKTA